MGRVVVPVPWQAGQWAVMVRRWPRALRPPVVMWTEAKPSQAGQILGRGGV
uniref:Orf50 n=1 Tax=Streptomyces ambofaciens TaxID=1889 RepID=Q53732_STRAM|nr:orf50 [Streptomyces ambofaciens]CAA79647.1 Orf50 [Streptomyces ambofaciens]